MRRLGLAAVAASVLLSASAGALGDNDDSPPQLRVGGLEVNSGTGELSALIGAVNGDGSPATLGEVRLLLDDKDAGPALGQTHLAEYAADHAKWVPPIAVGLVYLWTKDAPKGMIDGIESFARHLPGRTTVYPTPYGQGYRPVISKVTAARAAGGELADYTPIDGDRHKVIDAVRFNARKLAEDGAAIKFLVVVTDGRGYESAREKGPFAALGAELGKLDISVIIVSFAAPVDGAESAANARELAQAAGARHVVADRLSDLPAMVESAGDAINGLNRVRFKLPWSALSHTRKVAFTTTVSGTTLTVPAGQANLPGHGGWWIAGGLVVAAVGLGLVAFLTLGRGVSFGGGSRKPPIAPPGILKDTDELIRIGLSPERAVIELSRSRPDSLDELRAVDPTKLPSRLYRYLRSRAGQARLKEIQKLLARAETHEVIDEQEAQIIASTMQAGEAASEAARRIRARIPGERWSVLARSTEDDLRDAAQAAARKLPDLASPRGLEFVEAVQQALRSGDSKPVMVGWLVRASGTGERGETLLIERRSCTIGRRNADIVLSDANDEHAEIRQVGSEFLISPADGEVEVEGTTVTDSHTLIDGETIRIGRSTFIFRSVRWGIGVDDITPESSGRPVARRPERSTELRRRRT